MSRMWRLCIFRQRNLSPGHIAELHFSFLVVCINTSPIDRLKTPSLFELRTPPSLTITPTLKDSCTVTVVVDFLVHVNHSSLGNPEKGRKYRGNEFFF